MVHQRAARGVDQHRAVAQQREPAARRAGAAWTAAPGACRLTTSALASSSSSAHRLARQASARYGSDTSTSRSNGASSSITRRPTRDAPITPDGLAVVADAAGTRRARRRARAARDSRARPRARPCWRAGSWPACTPPPAARWPRRRWRRGCRAPSRPAVTWPLRAARRRARWPAGAAPRQRRRVDRRAAPAGEQHLGGSRGGADSGRRSTSASSRRRASEAGVNSRSRATGDMASADAGPSAPPAPPACAASRSDRVRRRRPARTRAARRRRRPARAPPATGLPARPAAAARRAATRRRRAAPARRGMTARSPASAASSGTPCGGCQYVRALRRPPAAPAPTPGSSVSVPPWNSSATSSAPAASTAARTPSATPPARARSASPSRRGRPRCGSAARPAGGRSPAPARSPRVARAEVGAVGRDGHARALAGLPRALRRREVARRDVHVRAPLDRGQPRARGDRHDLRRRPSRRSVTEQRPGRMRQDESMSSLGDRRARSEERVDALLGEMTRRGEARPAGQRVGGRGARLGQRGADAGGVRRAARRSRRPARTGSATSPARTGTSPSTRSRARGGSPSLQREVVAAHRLGIPAIAHEECLTGFTTFGATVYPTPLALAATFDPDGRRADDRARSARRCAPSASTRASRR